MNNARSKLCVSIEKIVSGGQTGADWVALDFAIDHGLPHGGWCPKGRLAENGTIDPRFHLEETPDSDYARRTEWNVRDSDGTVIFSIGPTLRGGSRRTAEFAAQHQKPWIHISASKGVVADQARELARFVREHKICVLNIAGSRASEEADIASFVRTVLDDLVAR